MATLTILGLIILGVVTLVVFLIMVPFEKIFGRSGGESNWGRSRVRSMVQGENDNKSQIHEGQWKHYPDWFSRPPMTINLSLKDARTREGVPVNFPASFKIAFQPSQSKAEHLIGLALQVTPPSTIEAGTREILQEASEQALSSMNIEQINVNRDVFLTKITEIADRELGRLLLKIIDLEIFSTTDDNGFIPPLGLGDRIFGTIEMTIRSNMQQIGLRIIPDYGDARWEIDSIRLQNRLAAVETSPSPDLDHSKIRFNFGNTAFYLARKLSWKAVSSAHRWENGKWVELYSNKKGDTFELEDIDSLLENDN